MTFTRPLRRKDPVNPTMSGSLCLGTRKLLTRFDKRMIVFVVLSMIIGGQIWLQNHVQIDFSEAMMGRGVHTNVEDISYEHEGSLLSEAPHYSTPDGRRQKKIILLGPHERYNFGDLLFSKVIERLLVTRAGYDPKDILQGGTIPRNMTAYGGWDNIMSMKTLQQMSRTDSVYGPYDIIYTGGEAMGCPHKLAVNFLPEDLKGLAFKEYIYDCAYLVPKEYLLPIDTPKEKMLSSNYAIVNNMGGSAIPSCWEAVKHADFIAYRDKAPLFPDSAVMTRELFHDDIADMAKVVLKELFPDGKKKKYIAVQHSTTHGVEKKKLARELDEIARETGAVIVFFAAGTARWHDSFDLYHEIAAQMKQPHIVYEMENAWKVVGLISQAHAVLGTSLHVRIMSFIYFKPRITWCTEGKHRGFISLWDTSDSPQCIDVSQTWKVLQKYVEVGFVSTQPLITQEMTLRAYKKSVKKYLEGFDKWSRMLVEGDKSISMSDRN